MRSSILTALLQMLMLSGFLRAQTLPEGVLEYSSVRLPGRATSVHPAAGGKLLFYRLPELKVLAALDTSTRSITGYVPLPSRHALVTAGRDVLFVVDPGTRRIQRWSLPDLKQMYDGRLTEKRVRAIGMGCAANGPLAIVAGSGAAASGVANQIPSQRTPITPDAVRFLDPTSLAPITITIATSQQAGRSAQSTAADTLRVSDDGKTFLFPEDYFYMQVDGNQATVRSFPGTPFHFPSSNGQMCFGRPVPMPITGDNRPQETRSGCTHNGIASPYYLTSQPVVGRPTVTVGKVAITGSSEFIREFQITPFQLDRTESTLPLGERLSFVPEQGLVACLHRLDREIWCATLDLQTLASEAPVLLVNSPGAFTVFTEDTFIHDLDVSSNIPDRHAVMEFGPPGFTISPEGHMEWTVPKDIPLTNITALLSVRSGHHCRFHTITLTPKSKLPETTRRSVPSAEIVAEPPVAHPAGGRTYSVPDPMTIVSSPFDDPRFSSPLPAAGGRVAAAGGGRFLLIELPSLGKLAVFDLNVAQITGYLPLEGSKPYFVGGGDAAFVGNMDHAGDSRSRTLRRWSLKTLELEQTLDAPEGQAFRGAMMGVAVTDHLLVAIGNDGLVPVRADTLEPQPTPFDRQLPMFDAVPSYISPDGTTLFTASDMPEKRQGPRGSFVPACLRRNPDWEVTFRTQNRELIGTANPEFLVDGIGFCSAECGENVVAFRNSGSHIPSISDDLVLTIAADGLELRTIGVAPPIATIALPAELKRDLRGRNPVDRISQIAWLIPQAETLAILSADRTQLVLNRFRLREILDNAEHYIRVVNPPGVIGTVGQSYECSITTESSSGSVTYELTEGPEGMTISESGTITWAVPADWNTLRQNVVVTLTADTRAVQHAFTIVFPELIEDRLAVRRR